MKKHCQLKKYQHIDIYLGGFTYRGVRIESTWRRERRSTASDFAPGMKWYWQGRCGSPSLAYILNSIDYEFCHAPAMTEELRARPVGSFFHHAGVWYVKTNFCGEHEEVGNWYVNTETGEVAHYGTLACKHVGFKPRA